MVEMIKAYFFYQFSIALVKKKKKKRTATWNAEEKKRQSFQIFGKCKADK